jgi:hypothetical protein
MVLQVAIGYSSVYPDKYTGVLISSRYVITTHYLL